MDISEPTLQIKPTDISNSINLWIARHRGARNILITAVCPEQHSQRVDLYRLIFYACKAADRMQGKPVMNADEQQLLTTKLRQSRDIENINSIVIRCHVERASAVRPVYLSKSDA